MEKGTKLDRISTIVRIPKKLKDDISEKAKSMGVSVNTYMILLLQQNLNLVCKGE